MANLMDAPDVLKKIAAYKADEVKALKKRTNIKELRAYAAKLPAPKGFASALEKAAKTGPALIAEARVSRQQCDIRSSAQGLAASITTKRLHGWTHPDSRITRAWSGLRALTPFIISRPKPQKTRY